MSGHGTEHMPSRDRRPDSELDLENVHVGVLGRVGSGGLGSWMI
jgi:hypothetical protein